MTDQLPGRTPPWVSGAWAYSASPAAQPVRIGDAERDEALDKLGDHFAAGRLTREELDERTEKAMGARFDRDLAALFHDLPDRSPATTVARRSRPQPPAALSAAVMALVPLLVLAVVASIAMHGAILVAPLVWLFILSGSGRRHHYR